MKKILFMLVLTGCYSKEPEGVPQNGASTSNLLQSDSTTTVQRTSVFRDDTAYSGYRSVYIIKDVKTGKEYIGLSGVGISERGSHTEDKTSKDDER